MSEQILIRARVLLKLWLIRLRGGSCQINSITVGIAKRTASHRAVAAAMITAMVAGTTASGARAASCGRGLGGCPPVSRASSGGNAKAMKIRAASPVTLCLTSSIPSLWMGLTERGEHSSDLESTAQHGRSGQGRDHLVAAVLALDGQRGGMKGYMTMRTACSGARGVIRRGWSRSGWMAKRCGVPGIAMVTSGICWPHSSAAPPDSPGVGQARRAVTRAERRRAGPRLAGRGAPRHLAVGSRPVGPSGHRDPMRRDSSCLTGMARQDA